jgi:hypothetical protein
VVSLDEYDASDIIKILIAAKELSLHELITLLQSFLIENKSEWIELNFNDIYQTSIENNSFSELQNYCNDLISKDPDKIFRSLNFSSTSEKVLISLIQSDNLQISEIQVWECILKWGHAQNPELPSNPTDFSKEEFKTLKNSLQQYIPFIKFYNLAPEEFSSKVLPYKKILPKELYNDLLKYFLNPSNRSAKKSEPCATKDEKINSKHIDSKIITLQHAELILKWINMNDPSTYTSMFAKWIYSGATTINTSTFKLLLRGTRDGFTPEKFHEICDDQSHTVTIIKVKDSNEILGGYNPIAWKSDKSHGTTKDSFIFSFKDNNIESHILSRIKYESKAIYNSYNVGPSFSIGDLNLRNKTGKCSNVSYEKPIRETTNNFLVEEYEIFQIKRD